MSSRLFADSASNSTRDIQALRSALGLTSSSYYPPTASQSAQGTTEEDISKIQSEARQPGEQGLQARQWLINNEIVPLFQKAVSDKPTFMRMYEQVKQARKQKQTPATGQAAPEQPKQAKRAADENQAPPSQAAVAPEQPKKSPKSKKRSAETQKGESQSPMKIPRKNGDSQSTSPKEPEVWEVEKFVDYDAKKNLVFVKWKNCPHKRNTWEPKKTLKEDLGDLFDELWETMQTPKKTLSKSATSSSPGRKKAANLHSEVSSAAKPDTSAANVGSPPRKNLGSGSQKSQNESKTVKSPPRKNLDSEAQTTQNVTKPKGSSSTHKEGQKAQKLQETTSEESEDETSAEEDAWEVERFVEYDSKSGKIQVKWKNWAHKWNTWEPKRTLQEDLGELFDTLWEEMMSKQKGTGKKTTKPAKKSSAPKTKKKTNQTWEVERFAAFDSEGQKVLVKWKDCPSKENTWEPISTLKADLGNVFDELWYDHVHG